MSDPKTIERILAKWSASLKSRDRSAKNVRPNFEELFDEWKSCGASFEDLYEDPASEAKVGQSPLQRAIKAHQPSSSIARASYKKFKQIIPNFDKTEKEFIEEWNKSIEDTATESFFDYFPPPKEDEDPEPKVYGNMSAKEYNAQRRYADQFPTLDTRELVKQWREEQDNLNIDDMIQNVLGDDNEA
jgi:hypothetical protein